MDNVSENPAFVDVTEEFQKFRLILRTIWNSYLWENPEMRDWDMVDHFDECRPTLFKGLLVEKVRRSLNLQVGATVTFLVVPIASFGVKLGASIRISETDDSWNQKPLFVLKDEVILHFKDFFDWGPCDYRDFRYFRVGVYYSDMYPTLTGREALIEINNSAVLAFPGERSNDEVKSLLAGFWPGV